MRIDQEDFLSLSSGQPAFNFSLEHLLRTYNTRNIDNKQKQKDPKETSCQYKSLVLNCFTDWNEKKSIKYDFCPHQEYQLAGGFSQGKIISVNWLLCYRFFLL